MMTDIDPYVYLAAHDLRAPLMSAKGLLNLMQQDSEKETFDQYVILLNRSLDKMNQSISDIITYSRAGEEKIKSQAVEFESIAKESIQYLRYMAGAESIQINLQIGEGGIFFSDHNLLFSIFCNIISNAIRYRDVKKISFLEINIAFSKGGCTTVFRDNGIGIEKNLQAKIFDKFFLVNYKDEGTGIGLYRVKSATEKLGGSIRVESRIGEGTTFILQIPNLLAESDHF